MRGALFVLVAETWLKLPRWCGGLIRADLGVVGFIDCYPFVWTPSEIPTVFTALRDPWAKLFPLALAAPSWRF